LRSDLLFDITLPDIGVPPYIDQFPTSLTNPIFIRKNDHHATVDITVEYGGESFRVSVGEPLDISTLRPAIQRRLNSSARAIGAFDFQLTDKSGSKLQDGSAIPNPPIVVVSFRTGNISLQLMIGGKVETYDFHSDAHIADVRSCISSHFNIQADESQKIDFFYLGRHLDDDFPVHRIKEGFFITVVIPLIPLHRLTEPQILRTKCGDSVYDFQVTFDHRIGDIRELIAKARSVDAGRVILSAAGIILIEDDTRLERLGLCHSELDFTIDSENGAELRSAIRLALQPRASLLDSGFVAFTVEDEAELNASLYGGDEDDTVDQEVERKAVESLTVNDFQRLQALKRDEHLIKMTRLELILWFLECQRDFDRLERSLLLK
jgi:hypothetical protein